MSYTSAEAFPFLYSVGSFAVAGSFAVLGLNAFFGPMSTVRTYGLCSPDSIAQNDQYLSLAIKRIGARDISISVALFTFYCMSKPKEMGVLILAGLIVAVTDSWYVWRARRDFYAATFWLNAAIWAGIGIALVTL